MWIAACCLAYEVPPATLNLKDYMATLFSHLGIQPGPAAA